MPWRVCWHCGGCTFAECYAGRRGIRREKEGVMPACSMPAGLIHSSQTSHIPFSPCACSRISWATSRTRTSSGAHPMVPPAGQLRHSATRACSRGPTHKSWVRGAGVSGWLPNWWLGWFGVWHVMKPVQVGFGPAMCTKCPSPIRQRRRAPSVHASGLQQAAWCFRGATSGFTSSSSRHAHCCTCLDGGWQGTSSAVVVLPVASMHLPPLLCHANTPQACSPSCAPFGEFDLCDMFYCISHPAPS